MGRIGVSENLVIELYSMKDQVDVHTNTQFLKPLENDILSGEGHVLYRFHTNSTSYIISDREGVLEIIFRLSSNNFLFDLEGYSHQIHLLFKSDYFSQFTNVYTDKCEYSINNGVSEKNENVKHPNDSTSSFIPQKLKDQFYKTLFVSCESQSLLFQMLTLCKKINSEYSLGMAIKDRMFLESAALKLLVECIEVSERLPPLCDACSFLEKTDSSDKIRDAMNFIHQHFKESITIPQIAKEVGINQCYLKKGFKEIYGKTIYSSVQSLRMELAHQLVKSTDLTISNIAYEVGYVNPTSFTTSFKQYFGYTPQGLRQEE